MSTKYKYGDRVPNTTLAKRLFELSDAIGDKESMIREFTRRIPAELDRDADLVLWQAAERIYQLHDENERLNAALATVDEVLRKHKLTVDTGRLVILDAGETQPKDR